MKKEDLGFIKKVIPFCDVFNLVPVNLPSIAAEFDVPSIEFCIQHVKEVVKRHAKRDGCGIKSDEKNQCTTTGKITCKSACFVGDRGIQPLSLASGLQALKYFVSFADGSCFMKEEFPAD